jgi:hypothetical protein
MTDPQSTRDFSHRLLVLFLRRLNAVSHKVSITDVLCDLAVGDPAVFDVLDAVIAQAEGRVTSEEIPELGKTAAEVALDMIAVLCGCSEWAYPGQVVRDVTIMSSRMRVVEHELQACRARLQNVLQLNEECCKSLGHTQRELRARDASRDGQTRALTAIARDCETARNKSLRKEPGEDFETYSTEPEWVLVEDVYDIANRALCGHYPPAHDPEPSAPVAQLVERSPEERGVAGSTPAWGTDRETP